MEKVVYVIGSFDLFHRGHVELLRRARALGDRLIVAINGDDIVEKYKRRPYIKEDDRLAVGTWMRLLLFILSIIKKLFVNMVLILLFMGMIGVVCLIWNKFV
jgi:cytidyltransferase-like protein